jgi:3-phenylpropionate/cinnamic acid dioxygenase small subunit
VDDFIKTQQSRMAVMQLLIDYAKACDNRTWIAFDTIFGPEVSVDYGGEFVIEGLDKVVGMIKSMLGGCGPTQHLLGNHEITINGNTAQSRCYVRAIHAGLGDEAETLYEVWAEYHDNLEYTSDGWRISHRKMLVHKETGSRGVLKPA